MTRRLSSDRKRRLDALEAETHERNTNPVQVLCRDDQTGNLVDGDGDPVEPDPNAETVITIRERIVDTPWQPPEDADHPVGGSP